MKSNNTKKLPEWLKNIQENSWELELLISGGAIFTLFQIADVLTNFTESAGIVAHLPGRSLFFMLGMLGIKILTLGFIMHLMLRAFWLCLVCINYVHPQGINKEKIKWKKPFKISIDDQEDLKGPIQKIDNASGTVMFLTIISTLIIFGFLISVFLFVTLPLFIFGKSKGCIMWSPAAPSFKIVSSDTSLYLLLII